MNRFYKFSSSKGPREFYIIIYFIYFILYEILAFLKKIKYGKVPKPSSVLDFTAFFFYRYPRGRNFEG